MEFSHNCSNCGHQVKEDDKFCNQCGQKQPLNNLSFRAMISDMWHVMTNIDNSFFRTLRDIWRPWRLTHFYILGQRKKYINPFRFFLLLLLIYVGLLVSQVDWNKIIHSNFNLDIAGIPLSSNLFNDYVNTKQIDSVRINIKNLKSQYSGHDSLFSKIDSIILKNHPLVLKDSVLKTKINNKQYIFKIDDILYMNTNSIYDKYEVTAFLDKLIIKQSIKAIKNPVGVLKVWFGNLTWMIVLTIIILALFFKLLYYNQGKPYVEHVILLANIHSLSFLVCIMLLLLSSYFNDLYFPIVLIPIIIFIISIKLYYKNSIFITLLKSFVSSIIYLIFFTLSLAVIALTSFFIF